MYWLWDKAQRRCDFSKAAQVDHDDWSRQGTAARPRGTARVREDTIAMAIHRRRLEILQAHRAARLQAPAPEFQDDDDVWTSHPLEEDGFEEAEARGGRGLR